MEAVGLGEFAVYLPSFTYGMTFIDLVKAFDRIPFHVLVQQAIKLGYSLWVLRLSIAAYRTPRIIRIDGAVSQRVVPRRSTRAGSSMATTEMRITLVHVVDAALMVAPMVRPTLYVDHLSAEVSGGVRFVVEQISMFTGEFCRIIKEELMEVSRTKSVRTASSLSSERNLARALER